MDWWTEDLHRLWTTDGPLRRTTGCPPATHRLRPVVPSDPGLLHMSVHCSATRWPLSPLQVNRVTPSCLIGLWESWVKLGTHLGRTGPPLCTACAELSAVHRTARLSTGAAHRPRGQKTASDLGERSYPRYPQALLLLPTIESREFVSKRVLCTTRSPALGRALSRLDPRGISCQWHASDWSPVLFPSRRGPAPERTGYRQAGRLRATERGRATAPATSGGG